jgi:hypothetical protein
VERTNVREETSGKTGMQQQHKEPRLKEATTSWKQEDIWQDVQENHLAGDGEVNSQIFCLD